MIERFNGDLFFSYGKNTRFFPWPVTFREGVQLACPQTTASVKLEYVHPFAQLQSVTEDASHLNFALNSPHGVRVDSVREFYSEVFFHNLFKEWNRLTELERVERLAGLLSEDSRSRFQNIVDALYGDEDELGRAPLYLVASGDGAKPEEKMGMAHFTPNQSRSISSDEEF